VSEFVVKQILIFVCACGCFLLNFSAYAANANEAPKEALKNEAPTVRHVDVLSSGNHLEIEITTSAPITPRAQVISRPDRLIVDFPGARPDASLRNIAVNRGEVKDVRVGLFSQNPPTTRVVFDMKAAPQYRIFPSGKTIIVKLGEPGPESASANNASPAASSQTASLGAIGTVTGGTVALLATPKPAAVAATAPNVRVQFQNGKLSIWADKATLANVLYEVRRCTGAEVTVPPAASQEPIVADVPALPPREAIAALLDGSNFDFILMGSDKDPQSLHSIVLTPRGGGSGADETFYPAVQSPADANANNANADADVNAQPEIHPDAQAPPPDVQTTPEPQPDMVPQQQPENSAQPPQNDQQ
jgi:hypothetical protein